MRDLVRPLVTSAFALLTLATAVPHAQAQGDPPPPPSAGSSSGRPEPTTLGIGFGMTIGAGTDLMQPNTASVRFVVNEKLTLEPIVNLSFAKMSNDPGAGPSTSSSTVTLGVGAGGRYVLASRGPIDVSALGRATFQHVANDLATDTDNQAFGIGWGVGLSWFFAHNWALSLDATNPFFTFTRNHVDNGATNTTWLLGAIWQPNVLLILHMYF